MVGKPADVVSLYENITDAEQGNEDAPQPQDPFSEVVQYGIAGASHSVVSPSPVNTPGCTDESEARR